MGTQDQRKLIVRKLISLLEKDRHEIAMALHDHAGQLLTALKMDLEVLEGELVSPRALEIAKSAENKVTELLDFIKNVSRNLRPSSLDDLGLMPCLQSLIDRMRRQTGIDIQLKEEGLPEKLHPDKMLALYRIVQESLNNIVKYAEADEVLVHLFCCNDAIHLSVNDNGIGFDSRTVGKMIGSQQCAMGLGIMKERARQVGGNLKIQSAVGNGTMVRVNIPMSETFEQDQREERLNGIG